MKLTDFAMIFIAITLPIIIVVYINVSYTIKAEEQEMYYDNLINAAIEDATYAMKEIENEDKNIDYGYSGEENKKISINANIALDTFFNSLYNNFGIKGNEAAERYLQLFVPALVILDYNGVYISSMEEYVNENNETIVEHTLKPKKFFTYTYYVLTNKDEDGLSRVIDARDWNGKDTITSAHTVEFTMDDYITHRGVVYENRSQKELKEWSFYLADIRKGTLVEGDNPTAADIINNRDLYEGLNDNNENSKNYRMLEKIVKHLKGVKDQVIISTITDEIAYSVNANNFYAASTGVKYDFVFPSITKGQMGEYIDEVGILAFVQGLSIGNRYLETQSYSVSRLELVNRYYLSVASDLSANQKNLYHTSKTCPEYKKSNSNVIPEYVLSKQQASALIANYKNEKSQNVAAKGFYPCPVCVMH